MEIVSLLGGTFFLLYGDVGNLMLYYESIVNDFICINKEKNDDFSRNDNI